MTICIIINYSQKILLGDFSRGENLSQKWKTFGFFFQKLFFILKYFKSLLSDKLLLTNHGTQLK